MEAMNLPMIRGKRRSGTDANRTSFLLLICLSYTALLCLYVTFTSTPLSLASSSYDTVGRKPVLKHYARIQDLQTFEKRQPNALPTNISSSSSNGNGGSKQVLCVLLTTFKSSSLRTDIQQSILVNWAALRPHVQPVLFLTKDTEMYRRNAEALGWDVFDVPRTNRHGTPHLADMVDVIMNVSRYDAVFYGFANGDILFDRWLLVTLTSLVDHWKDDSVSLTSLKSQPIMSTGRRTNYKLNAGQSSSSSSRSYHLLANFARVAHMHKEGRLYAANAEDYFLFTRTIPRRLFIRELVFGRPAYDNYLVAMATKRGVAMVDVTRTVRAVHVQVGEGEWEQAGFNNTDAMHNIRVIGITGHFDFGAGETTKMRYETRFQTRLSRDGEAGDAEKNPWHIVVKDRSIADVV